MYEYPKGGIHFSEYLNYMFDISKLITLLTPFNIFITQQQKREERINI